MTLLKKKVFLSTVFVFLLAMAVFSSVRLVNVDANNRTEQIMNKYFTSYEIQPGDTLISIAEKYTNNTDISIDQYVEEVKKNNKISSSKITSGNHLIVAYYSMEEK